MYASQAQSPERLPPPASQAIDFARDIEPIFTKNCFRCHGPTKQKGGLALHLSDRALAGGDSGPAIVPGKSAESRLIRYVAGLEKRTSCPQGAGAPLSPPRLVCSAPGSIRAHTGRHTAAVASAGKHWSFQPPRRPSTPAVKKVGWPRNAIDQFVLARLEKEGLAPAPEAERHHADPQAHSGPDRPAADALPRSMPSLPTTGRAPIERLVDRLLASPDYGECWGRHWLDQARYADTNGYEKDRERSIWPYRDWVIRAFNRDMPFDRFTIDQIAGDLLPGATSTRRIATGFHRNTMINEEGGIDIEEFRFAALIDRQNTTGTVWLGLTDRLGAVPFTQVRSDHPGASIIASSPSSTMPTSRTWRSPSPDSPPSVPRVKPGSTISSRLWTALSPPGTSQLAGQDECLGEVASPRALAGPPAHAAGLEEARHADGSADASVLATGDKAEQRCL